MTPRLNDRSPAALNCTSNYRIPVPSRWPARRLVAHYSPDPACCSCCAEKRSCVCRVCVQRLSLASFALNLDLRYDTSACLLFLYHLSIARPPLPHQCKGRALRPPAVWQWPARAAGASPRPAAPSAPYATISSDDSHTLKLNRISLFFSELAPALGFRSSLSSCRPSTPCARSDAADGPRHCRRQGRRVTPGESFDEGQARRDRRQLR